MPRIKISPQDVADPNALHRLLHQLIVAYHETSKAYRSSPRLQATIIEGVKFTAGSDIVTIQHSYGTIVRYEVVRWIGATNATACQYSETKNNGTYLTLHAITSGTADLEIWPV